MNIVFYEWANFVECMKISTNCERNISTRMHLLCEEFMYLYN